MGANSKIEWTHHTFNPWWGCVRVSPACKHCYAEAWSRRLALELWGKSTQRRFFSDAHWRHPLRWNEMARKSGQRFRVFCASMADVFEERGDLDEPRKRLWPLIEATPHLDWLLLTKRPHHVRACVPWSGGTWPDNVWIGTTAENQRWADERVEALVSLPAKVRFLSCEPLLGLLSLERWLSRTDQGDSRPIDWVIAGGESGPKARPMNPAWVRSLRDQCVRNGVAFHFKQWGHWAPVSSVDAKGFATVTFRGNNGEQEILGKFGKQVAGRHLDGQTWDELPMAGKVAADGNRQTAFLASS